MTEAEGFWRSARQRRGSALAVRGRVWQGMLGICVACDWPACSARSRARLRGAELPLLREHLSVAPVEDEELQAVRHGVLVDPLAPELGAPLAKEDCRFEAFFVESFPFPDLAERHVRA